MTPIAWEIGLGFFTLKQMKQVNNPIVNLRQYRKLRLDMDRSDPKHSVNSSESHQLHNFLGMGICVCRSRLAEPQTQ